MNARAPRTLALVGGESGCSVWRVWQPFAELTRRGYVAEWCYLDDVEKVFPQLALGVYDTVVLPRLFWYRSTGGAGRRWIDKLHSVGVTVVYEVDDDVFSPQIAERQHATTEPDKSVEQLENERRDRIAAARLCDGVTTTTDLLARLIAQYVDTPVRVVPNRIDVRWWRGAVRDVRRLVPPLTVGWSGGTRIGDDLEPIAAAWSAIAERYPRVNFVVQGYQSDALTEAVPDNRLFRLPWAWVEPRGNGIANDYPMAMKNIDIGCASVADSHFNRCKTPIKLWEYTLAGAVSVVSPTLYGEVATDGVDALVAESATEWEDALSRLIESADLRRSLWRSQRKRLAADHALERNADAWPRAWAEIRDAHRARAARPKILLPA